MAASTGPIIAAGMVTAFNAIIIHDRPAGGQFPTAVGTAIAAAGLALLEHAMPTTARALAWTVLITVLFVRLDPRVPAPLESAADWYRGN